MSLRDLLETSILESVRSYTWNSPVRKGKGRLYRAALSAFRDIPRNRLIRLSDGRLLSMTYSLGRNDHVVFVGEYEPFLTKICSELIEPDDVCVDVGANFGWYTTLFARLAGDGGEVHSFDPIPEAFHELEANVALSPNRDQIRTNMCALGDRESEIVVNVFPGIGLGYSSLSDRGRDDAEPRRCEMTTLDAYWTEFGTRDIRFLKADVEGAELFVLRGAASALQQACPPILLLELSEDLTRGCGYTPVDLLSFLGERSAYEFLAADESRLKLRRLDDWRHANTNTNVFCLPKNLTADRRARLSKYIDRG